MLYSYYRKLDPVRLPAYRGLDVYMQEFDLASPSLPSALADYEEPVKKLCSSALAIVGTAYLTIDEKIVKAGMSQRRPGPHVDGRFENGGWKHGPKWVHNDQQRTAVIVAASVPGCRVWQGEFDGMPSECGDLDHIDDQLAFARNRVLKANHGYWLSPDCVHESMIFKTDTQRQFMRIALPCL